MELMAYLVTRRTREIGIRIALGSSPKAVIWLVAKEALRLLGFGIVSGRLRRNDRKPIVASQLFGVRHRIQSPFWEQRS